MRNDATGLSQDMLMPTSRANLTTVIAGALAGGALLWSLLPQFFSFDSYAYIALGMHPQGHALRQPGFGWMLLALARFANLQPWLNLNDLLLGWHSLFFGLMALWVKQHWRTTSTTGRIVLVVSTPLVIVATMFVANGFWAEVTAWTFVLLLCLVLSHERGNRGARLWVMLFGLVLLATMARRQLMILPLALLATMLTANLSKPARRSGLIGVVLLGTAVLLVHQQKDQYFVRNFPEDPYGRAFFPDLVKKSLQCRLKCDLAMYETDCSTEQGRALVERTQCHELVQFMTSLGPPRVEQPSVLAAIRYAGAEKTLRWLAQAPLDYLGEFYPHLEYQAFGFDAGHSLLTEHADTRAVYAQALDPGPLTPSATMRKLIDLNRWLYEHAAFHVMTALSVFLALFALLERSGRNITSVFLAWFIVGTYLTFAYFQPQTPLRYLLQVILPGWWLLPRVFERRHARTARASNNAGEGLRPAL
ncbi:MAG: hypothetical protein KDG50_08630 [Chromatiales bacterium]|nr:hypothetical protein [Chromatiales bacterium]